MLYINRFGTLVRERARITPDITLLKLTENTKKVARKFEKKS